MKYSRNPATKELEAYSDDGVYLGRVFSVNDNSGGFGAKPRKTVDNEPDISDGGPGSGNFGHKGRPGMIGGSGGGGGGKTSQSALRESSGHDIISYGSSTYNPKAFKKTKPKDFLKTFHQAKAEVAKTKPEDAWRVDSSYTEEDYADMDCYTTEGGSAVAVHNGDIVSVCKNPNDKTCRGSDLLTHAVANGGNKLDAFSGLYGFYIKNGFEPVSWCAFADVKGIRPNDWVRGRDKKEPVIFFKYTGKITKRYQLSTERKRVSLLDVLSGLKIIQQLRKRVMIAWEVDAE